VIRGSKGVLDEATDSRVPGTSVGWPAAGSTSKHMSNSADSSEKKRIVRTSCVRYDSMYRLPKEPKKKRTKRQHNDFLDEA
jgi:hypothetical protein